jgi:16S rRNA (adenine1518-N6/adenine1519-N6)-dimethyltransferase
MNDTPGALLGPADIRDLAGRLGVRPTKTLGQNFVHDAGTVRKIVRAAGVEPGQRVVEVGPGLGSLTLGLLEAGASVVAVEIDPVLAGQIAATVAQRAPGAADRFEVVTSDALDVTELPGEPPTALVANLPYNVAVPVLLTMLERFGSLQRVLVMVQAEVADRLAAAPGSKVYGVPSVKAAWYARTWRSLNVSRNVFWPVPNVDSALVAMERREPPATTATREQVFSVVDAAFAQRRKTLRAALSGRFGSGAAAEAALRAAGVDPSARGETLGIAEFARVAEQLPGAAGPGAGDRAADGPGGDAVRPDPAAGTVEP